MQNNMDLYLRASVVGDEHILAPILCRAFTQFNISVGIPPHVDYDNVETSKKFLHGMLQSPISYGITAFDKASGLPIGAAFLNYTGETVQAIGPLFVDPDRSNKGVGMALTNALIERANATNAMSIRLVQIAANTKSFSLYAKLGFQPVECISYFEGSMDEKLNSGTSVIPGFKVKMMEESDVHACSELHKSVLGHERETNIRDILQKTPENTWVAVKDGILQAYTTGFSLEGHSIAISEEAFKTLFQVVLREKEGGCSMNVHIPGRIHPFLIEWALKQGLRLVRHCWMMVIGQYQAPKIGFIWCPSIVG